MKRTTGQIAAGKVAVIGAGPAGLTAAKHLLEEGIEPVVLEQSDDLGGQWHRAAAHSAVWPGMRTNTSKTTTAFSDFPHPPSVPMFPCAEQVHDYLHEYAEHFGVRDHVRTSARVIEVARSGECWTVRWSEKGMVRQERFAGVVVASGRYRRPRFPAIPGLDGLRSAGRVRHSSGYQGRDEYHGKRVLVYGNSISALEISSDLANDHTISVISAYRSPRYVIQKVVRGLPSDWRWFNRLQALLGAALPPQDVGAGLRRAVLAEAGDPARYGALAIDPGGPPKLSQSQEYLAYVAEGRIATRPAVDRIEGATVHFTDGTCAEVDAVIVATGYELDLSYLAKDIRHTVNVGDTYLDLHARTFHPDLPGLAFLGHFVLIGPNFPTVELQARWVAGVWSGSVPAPTDARMREGIAEHRAAREIVPFDLFPMLAGLLAGELGVEPDLAAHSDLAEGLLFGPLAPARYRLDGPGSRPEAEAMLRAALSEFGPSPTATPEQARTLQMVAAMIEDAELSEIAERLIEQASEESANSPARA